MWLKDGSPYRRAKMVWLSFLLLSSLVINSAMAGVNDEIGYLALNDNIALRYRVSVPKSGAVRGSVLLLHGRAENIEKYAEQISRLNQMGFSVFTFDWRGQGLSSRLLDEPHKGYINTFTDYLEDLEAFDRQIWQKMTGDGKRYLIAHSLGGHIALRYLVEKKGALDAVLLISPMFEINTAPWPRQVAELFVSAAVLTGFEENYLPGSGPYIGRVYSSENVLTSDAARFAVLPGVINKNPDLALGGPTFGWLNAAFDSMKQIHMQGYVEKIETPMTVLVGEDDSVISPLPVHQLCRRISSCRNAVVKAAKHEIMMENEVIQELFWAEIEMLFN